MKRILLVLVILICPYGHSQEYTFEEKSITAIFDAQEKTRTEIFSSINKWVSINYNSAQDVIQLNDKEAGNIIIKGINETVYKNAMKEFYPKNKHITEFSIIKFNHTIEVNIKDDKYRIIYTLTDYIAEQVNAYYVEGLNELMFNMVDLTGMKQTAVDEYNIFIEDIWKKAMVGKKKREKIKGATRPVFEEMNKGIIESIKLTMQSINKSVNSNKKDDW